MFTGSRIDSFLLHASVGAWLCRQLGRWPGFGEAVADKDGNGTKRSLGPASSPYMMPYLTGRYKLSPGTVRHHTPNRIPTTAM